MLLIHESCREKLGQALLLAMQRNLLTGRNGLLDNLHYLGHYAEERAKQEGWKMKTTIYNDFAPFSFGFDVRLSPDGGKTWKGFLNGGLIYSGPDQPLDGSGPAFTVSLGEPGEGWSTHT